MTVRIFGQKMLHKFFVNDEDPRVAFTVCGIRFAWGALPGSRERLPHCKTCFP